MPLFTSHYNLGIKLANEPYSASMDRARFLTIDNQLGFLCDIIGDGRINGWHLSERSPYTVRVGSGIGLIDRFATRTFGPTDVTLSGDGTWFLWMRRKPNVIGGFGEFSQQVWFVEEDSTPPANPTGLSVASTTRTTVSLDWDPNLDTDIAAYRVYRSTDTDEGYLYEPA